MKKLCAFLLTLILCAFILSSLSSITTATSSCLENDLLLDFSQTQFSFIDPMESWFIFKFGATNVGTKTLMVHFEQYCVECPQHLPVQAPQGDVLLAPGESTWFKLVFQSGSLGYDPNVPQTINRTFCLKFFDNNFNYEGSGNMFSVNKTVTLQVVDHAPSYEGSVIIQGTTVDEEGHPLPNVAIELGTYSTSVHMTSDAAGHFSYSICPSSFYFLIAQKEGYRTKTVDIDGDNVQLSYTVTLVRESSPISVTASLMRSFTGKIGFWRCVATADESKLLLVNGMENWEDESIKNQSKLYFLDTNTGEILWTHNMGWESWSADITDDGKYVVFGTKLEGFQTGPPGFINYIRLLNGTDGSTIWEKKITTANFPNTTEGEFFTRAVKFSHNGNYILVPIHSQYVYLLNRADGSIKWVSWVGSEVREVIFTKDDQYVYVPSSSGYLYKFRTADGSQVWRQWIGCWPYVNGFDISPNEAYIAAATKGGYFVLLNTLDGSIRFTTDLHNGFSTCRFSPDGTKILVGGGLLTMFDLDGNVLWRCYADFTDMRFSAGGKLIFTSNGDVLDCNGTKLYDIIPGGARSTHVGWVNSNATRYIFAIQDTRSMDSVNIIEVYKVNTQESASPVPSPSPTPNTQTSGISSSSSNQPSSSNELSSSNQPSSSPNASNSADSPNSIPEFPASITVAVMLPLVLGIAAIVVKRSSKSDITKTCN